MNKGKAELLRADTGRGAELLGISEDRQLANLAGTEQTRHTVNGLDRWFARRILEAADDPPLTIRLWNGEEFGGSGQGRVGRITFFDRPALRRLLFKTDLHFGDAFSTGRIVVEGDLVQVLETIYQGLHRMQGRQPWRKRLHQWINRPNANSLETARGNIHHHYDLGNDFYQLWLDERMLYTCAYYPSEDATLEQAQVAKMEHVCRKLQLTPGMRVVEAGCGWGALALYMAQHYGVSVRAYNISHQQVVHARARAAAEGLEHLVEFVEDDYRTIDRSYDRFVSVGMLEHVGPQNFRELGQLIARSLERNGRGLLHSIGRNAPAPNNPWIEQRIFPGSRPPSLSEMSQIFEPQHLSILDIENLRMHYAQTCQDWLTRFEANVAEVEHMYDENFVRAWRLYLAGSVAAFTTGSLQLFQVLFAHQEDNQVPLTRSHLYG